MNGEEDALKNMYQFVDQLGPGPLDPGSKAVGREIKRLISEGIKRSGLSRYQVAARISELVGWDLTKTMLDAYTAESKAGHRVPAEILPAFCLATGYYMPLKALSEAAGGAFLETEQVVYAELAAVDEQISRLKEHQRKLKSLAQQTG